MAAVSSLLIDQRSKSSPQRRSHTGAAHSSVKDAAIGYDQNVIRRHGNIGHLTKSGRTLTGRHVDVCLPGRYRIVGADGTAAADSIFDRTKADSPIPNGF